VLDAARQRRPSLRTLLAPFPTENASIDRRPDDAGATLGLIGQR
jgi:hypothetical protein